MAAEYAASGIASSPSWLERIPFTSGLPMPSINSSIEILYPALCRYAGSSLMTSNKAIGNPVLSFNSQMFGKSASIIVTPSPSSVCSSRLPCSSTSSSRFSQNRVLGNPILIDLRLTSILPGEALSAIAASSNAISCIVLAMGPIVSLVLEIGITPSPGYRPTVGLKPKIPQSADGIRTEPPVSVPKPAGNCRELTADPVPPEEPPGIFDLS